MSSGNDAFNWGMVFASRRLELLTELLKRHSRSRASMQDLMKQVDEIMAWALSGERPK